MTRFRGILEAIPSQGLGTHLWSKSNQAYLDPPWYPSCWLSHDNELTHKHLALRNGQAAGRLTSQPPVAAIRTCPAVPYAVKYPSPGHGIQPNRQARIETSRIAPLRQAWRALTRAARMVLGRRNGSLMCRTDRWSRDPNNEDIAAEARTIFTSILRAKRHITSSRSRRV